MSKFSAFICLAAAVVFVSSAPLSEEWDVQNVIFSKADNGQTFHFIIASSVGENLEGTTYFDTDPHIQTLTVNTAGSSEQFQVSFTDSELQSSVLSKAITDLGSIDGISPLALKSIVG